MQLAKVLEVKGSTVLDLQRFQSHIVFQTLCFCRIRGRKGEDMEREGMVRWKVCVTTGNPSTGREGEARRRCVGNRFAPLLQIYFSLC